MNSVIVKEYLYDTEYLAHGKEWAEVMGRHGLDVVILMDEEYGEDGYEGIHYKTSWTKRKVREVIKWKEEFDLVWAKNKINWSR